VPSQIVAVKPACGAISIKRNADGLISDIWDPNGNRIQYEYEKTSTYEPSQPKRPYIQEQYLQRILWPDNNATLYGVHVSMERDMYTPRSSTFLPPRTYWFADLVSINTSNEVVWNFQYGPDLSKQNTYAAGGFIYNSISRLWERGTTPVARYAFPRPHVVKKVSGPTGTADFENQSNLVVAYRSGLPVPAGGRQVRVKSCAVDGTQIPTTYQFGAPTIYPVLSRAAVDRKYEAPLLFCYENLRVEHSTLGTGGEFPGGAVELFKFNPKAGMALESATDPYGNTTQFVHEESIISNPASAYAKMYNFASFNSLAPEPTKQINALGGVVEGVPVGTRFYTYDIDRRPLSETDEEGGRTDWQRDNVGRVVKEVKSGPRGGNLETNWIYGDDSVPGLPTRKTVIRQPGDTSVDGDLVTDYAYNGAGRLAAETAYPNGPGDGRKQLVTGYGYDNNGNRLGVTDPLGHGVAFHYDSRNRLIRTSFHGRVDKIFAYDARGNKVSEQDKNGNVARYVYNGLNLVINVVRRDSNIGYEYNPLGSKTKMRDPRGKITSWTFDGLQRMRTETDPLNNTTYYDYGPNSGGILVSGSFKPTMVKDARQFRTLTTFDKLGRPTQVSREYNVGVFSVSKFGYDGVGNVTLETDDLDKKTKHEYDSLNRRVETTFADTKKRKFGYSSTGLPCVVTNEKQYETWTEYDLAGRAIKVVGPKVSGNIINGETLTTETEYDDAGNVAAMIKPGLKRWVYVYDARNRKISEIAPLVHPLMSPATQPQYQWFYDGAGNVLATVDPRGYKTLNKYDELNRLVQRQLPDPEAIHTWTYDQAGNVTEEVDERALRTVNEYSDRNELTKTTDAEGIPVSYGYDEVGNRTTVTDGRNQTTRFEFDGLKRLIATYDPLDRAVTSQYNGVNKVSTTNARQQSTNYTYDDRHRLKTTSFSATGVVRTCTYEENGNLESVTETGNTEANVAYTYNSRDQIATETSSGATHEYLYDASGNRETLKYGIGNANFIPAVYEYDEANRVTKITDNGNATQYYYDASGNIEGKILPNGNLVTTTFTGRNQPKVILTTSGAGSGNQTIYSETLSYDRLGNVKSVAETFPDPKPGDANLNGVGSRMVMMTYDNANRLKTETEGDRVTTHSYDQANNYLGKTFTGGNGNGDTAVLVYGNSLNQVTSATFAKFANGVQASSRMFNYHYDNDGNRVDKDGVEDLSYTYDEENRLKTVTGAVNLAFKYDYRGRRVYRSNGASQSKVVFSGGTSVQERNPTTGAIEVRYARGLDMGGGVGGLVFTADALGTLTYAHYDHRGDMVTEMRGNTQIYWQGKYEARGQREAETPDPKTTRQTANTKDEEPTGLLNEGQRYRDLETGTFLTRDPAGFVDGPNLYAYVRQNPWSKFDPDGLYEQSVSDYADLGNAIIGGVVGAAKFVGGGVIGYSQVTFGVNKDFRSAGDNTVTAGLNTGRVVAGVQATAEIVGGGSLIVGGGGTSATGVGTVVGVPAAATGTALVGAGAYGLKNFSELGLESMSKTGGSSPEPSAKQTGENSKVDVAKEVKIDYNTHPEAAKHIDDAQAAGHPDVVIVDRPNSPSQRNAATGHLDKVPEKQLDEYPPAMFKEGGQGASVRPINPRDNMGAGASMGNQLRGVPDGAKVRIKTTNKPSQ